MVKLFDEIFQIGDVDGEGSDLSLIPAGKHNLTIMVYQQYAGCGSFVLTRDEARQLAEALLKWSAARGQA